jgi:alpha-glucoside transport system permease protein
VILAVCSTLRGVIWNNLWWVAAVTGLSTIFGLMLAVLADRSKNEKWAKTLIFMPMAISMVGAAVIWKYVYDVKSPVQSPGLLNAIIEFLGFKSTSFLLGAKLLPWNNFFIMIIMIWIQTGFAMTVLSAAIKGVPTELLEAARVDGATEVQVFWRVTLPQITPTIAVVVTTLIVSVMKVFDLVKATTGGAVKTDVLANQMYENLKTGNFTKSATFAVVILLLILPVMYYNIRTTRREAH